VGADEKMRGAMFDMLGFTHALGHSPASDLEAMRATITKAPQNPKENEASFDLANVVMFDPAAHPFPKAIDEMRRTGAEVSLAPLSDVANIRRINQWVAEKTHNLIPSILDEQPLPPGLVAVNALYFKGMWLQPFFKEATRPQAFHAVNSDVEVPMMHALRHYPFRREGDFAAADIGYRGGRYSLVVVTNTERSLGFNDFSAVTGWLDGTGFANKPVSISLPRFTLEAGEELLDPLKAIGLKNGIDSPTAFEGLAPEPPTITRVVQKTYLKVDEEGTEAAAATAVPMATSAATRQPETLALDRPFIFALRDRQTGLVLISGYIGKPVTGPAADLGGTQKFASGTNR
jgi:serpin B